MLSLGALSLGTRHTWRVELGERLPGEAALWTTVDVCLPEQLASPPTALFCIPGGGMHRRYFDMPGTFSFAGEMLARGLIVVLLETVGSGESSRPADGFALSGALLAACHQHAVAEVTARLELPGLVRLGVGHSMGAMLTILQQAEYAPHAALALLGFSTRGLPELVTAEEQAALAGPDWRAHVPRLACARFGGQAFAPIAGRPERDSPAALALRLAQDAVLSTPATHSMMPGNVAPEAACLTVPLFLGVGERDMVGPPHDLPRIYGACRDLTLFIVPGAGHHLFTVPASGAFFDRLAGWCLGQAQVFGVL